MASEMNENFQALEESIAIIANTPAPTAALTVRDPGTFAGEVGFGQTANFSLLTGAGGAVGVAAADAACEAAHPGSNAELDILVLWNAANNLVLPKSAVSFAYWASTVTPVPFSASFSTLVRTSDCAGWASGGQTSVGYIYGNISGDEVHVQFGNQSCSATNMAVACFIPD